MAPMDVMPEPGHVYPMEAEEKISILRDLGLLGELNALDSNLTTLSPAQHARLNSIRTPVYLRGRLGVEELQLHTLEEMFRSTLVDITLLSSRKAPKWIADVDVSPVMGNFAMWNIYRRYVHFYVPGEAWTRLPSAFLRDLDDSSAFYEQPWRTSLERVLRFANRLFCYPAHPPLDPHDPNPERHLHPARLRDYIRPPREPENWINDRSSIEFEVLCPFEAAFALDHEFVPVFRSPQDQHTMRALLWLFRTLECHRLENRHRLIITLRWKDARHEDKITRYPVLEWKGNQENCYANKDPATKASIPPGLGIKERHMQVIDEGLGIWCAYIIESTHLDRLRNQRKKQKQEERDRSSKAAPENDAMEVDTTDEEEEEEDLLTPADFPVTRQMERTTRLGIKAARGNVHATNLANHLARMMCNNVKKRVFDGSDRQQMAYLSFWQRVALNIAPVYIFQSTWAVTDEFVSYIDELSRWTYNSMFEFAEDPQEFRKKYKVEPQPDLYFPKPLVCRWKLGNPAAIGAELLKPEDDDFEDS